MRCKVLSIQEISSAGIYRASGKSKEDVFAEMVFKLKKVYKISLEDTADNSVSTASGW